MTCHLRVAYLPVCMWQGGNYLGTVKLYGGSGTYSGGSWKLLASLSGDGVCKLRQQSFPDATYENFMVSMCCNGRTTYQHMTAIEFDGPQVKWSPPPPPDPLTPPPPPPPTLPAPLWVDFFHGPISSSNVFAYFEQTSFSSPPDITNFLRRLPSSAQTSLLIRASVNGGVCTDATVEFELTNALLAFFRDGTQAGWQALRFPRVAAGSIASLPRFLWTGQDSNYGFILDDDKQSGGTFASHYSPNTGWDYCSGKPIIGNEYLTLSYRLDPSPPPPSHPPPPLPPPPPLLPAPGIPSSIFASCQQAKDLGGPSGKYKIDLSLSTLSPKTVLVSVGTTTIDVYCEMELAGGGWMLLLTQTSATTDFLGSVTPWQNYLSPGNPSRTSAYSRDWSNNGFGLLPTAGDEIMIARGSNNQYVRMQLSKWCSGPSLSTSDAGCGGKSGHPGFGEGTLYVGSSTSGSQFNLNGCSHVGGCSDGGVDGIAFSTHMSWANVSPKCYGSCYSGSTNGFHYWGTASPIIDKMNYFFRRKAYPPQPVSFEIFGSCSAALAAGHKTSGIYYMGLTLSQDDESTAADRVGERSIKVYCEMELAGGGWMLLLTQTSAMTDFLGSVTPWQNYLSPGNPSRTSAYSRDWSNNGFGLLPTAGDEIMIARGSNNQYVRMQLSKWCSGPSLSTSDAGCGGKSGHPGFGEGTLYVGSSTSGSQFNLNGCSHVGGCSDGGVDGIAFSTHMSWANVSPKCYGSCYTGATTGAFYWGSTVAIADKMNYFFRQAPRPPPFSPPPPPPPPSPSMPPPPPLTPSASATSCRELLELGYSTGDGEYQITPIVGGPPISVYCDMNVNHAGGGWTLMMETWYQSGLQQHGVAAYGTIADGLSKKGTPYKLSDANINAIKGGKDARFDIMATQHGFNSAYSNGNYECASRGVWRDGGVAGWRDGIKGIWASMAKGQGPGRAG